jgi:hypothetical protein
MPAIETGGVYESNPRQFFVIMHLRIDTYIHYMNTGYTISGCHKCPFTITTRAFDRINGFKISDNVVFVHDEILNRSGIGCWLLNIGYFFVLLKSLTVDLNSPLRILGQNFLIFTE